MKRLPQKGGDMTEDKKHDDNDRKKVSDEEMEDVAGGLGDIKGNATDTDISKGKKTGDGDSNYVPRAIHSR
ncbi:MAG: hypothetical protein VYD70_00755 [Planctomycetota bacterium]|nr:hypothetical protein [Planctomycetota bacterium]